MMRRFGCIITCIAWMMFTAFVSASHVVDPVPKVESKAASDPLHAPLPRTEYRAIDPAQFTAAYPGVGYNTSRMTAPLQDYVAKLAQDPKFEKVAEIDPEALSAYVIGFKEQNIVAKRSPDQFLSYEYKNWVDPENNSSAIPNLGMGLKLLNDTLSNPQFKYASPEGNQFMTNPINDYIIALRKQWSHVSDVSLATYITVFLKDPANYAYQQKPRTGPLGIISGGNDLSKPIQITPQDLVNRTKDMTMPMDGDRVYDSQLTESQKMYLTIKAIEDINKAHPQYQSPGGLYLGEPGSLPTLTGSSSSEQGINLNNVVDVHNDANMQQTSSVNIPISNTITSLPVVTNLVAPKIIEPIVEVLPVVNDKTPANLDRLVKISESLERGSGWSSWLSPASSNLTSEQVSQKQDQFIVNVKKQYGFSQNLKEQEVAFVQLSKDIELLETQMNAAQTAQFKKVQLQKILPDAQEALRSMQEVIENTEVTRLVIGTGLSLEQLLIKAQDNVTTNQDRVNNLNRQTPANKIKNKNNMIVAEQYQSIYAHELKLVEKINEIMNATSRVDITIARKNLQQAKALDVVNTDNVLIWTEIINQLNNRSQLIAEVNKQAQDLWNKVITASQNPTIDASGKDMPLPDPVSDALTALQAKLTSNPAQDYKDVVTKLQELQNQYNKAKKTKDNPVGNRVKALDALLNGDAFSSMNLRKLANDNPALADLTLSTDVIATKLQPRFELIQESIQGLTAQDKLVKNIKAIKDLQDTLTTINFKEQVQKLNELIDGTAFIRAQDIATKDDLAILYEQLLIELNTQANLANPWYQVWKNWSVGRNQLSRGQLEGAQKVLYTIPLGAHAVTNSLIGFVGDSLSSIGLAQYWKGLDKTEEGKAFKALIISAILVPAAGMLIAISQSNLSNDQKKKAQYDLLQNVVGDVATNLIAHNTGADVNIVATGDLQGMLMSGATNNMINQLGSSNGNGSSSTSAIKNSTPSTTNIDNFKNNFQYQYGFDPTQPVNQNSYGSAVNSRSNSNVGNTYQYSNQSTNSYMPSSSSSYRSPSYESSSSYTAPSSYQASNSSSLGSQVSMSSISSSPSMYQAIIPSPVTTPSYNSSTFGSISSQYKPSTNSSSMPAASLSSSSPSAFPISAPLSYISPAPVAPKIPYSPYTSSPYA